MLVFFLELSNLLGEILRRPKLPDMSIVKVLINKNKLISQTIFFFFVGIKKVIKLILLYLMMWAGLIPVNFCLQTFTLCLGNHDCSEKKKKIEVKYRPKKPCVT